MTRKLSDLKHTTVDIEGGGEVIVLDTGAVIDAEAEAMLQALHSRSTGGFRNHLKVLAEKGLGWKPLPIQLPKPAFTGAPTSFGRGFLKMVDKAEAKPKQIIKEGLSEYFIYTVEGRDTIPNGWVKRLPSFTALAVPVTSYYKHEAERWSDRVVRHYRFTNSVPSQLGREPLPDGAVQAFRLVSEDRLHAYLGDELFDTLAQHYIDRYPSRYRSLGDFGSHLVELASTAEPFSRWPEVAELAVIEPKPDGF